MNSKRTTESAFLYQEALIPLLLCIATVGTLLGFLRPEASTNNPQRTLTFAERVAYQRAIEEVYWRHRIWPKENSNPKPSLDTAMTELQLEKKVADYLRKSQALGDYWHRPITAEQLQGEIDRIAKHTKEPGVLQELYKALGNDPLVIAECLARPALADRLLHNWYAFDQRIHGKLKQQIHAELLAHPSTEQIKQLSGDYSETEVIRSGAASGENRGAVGHALRVDGRKWNTIVENLATIFGNRHAMVTAGWSPEKATIIEIKTGIMSALQEDEERFYALAVFSKNNNQLKFATVSWRKEPMEIWLGLTENQAGNPICVTSHPYSLPSISTGTCIDDTWTATASAASARNGHTAVWTGSEMIVWGGIGVGTLLNTGAKYNPTTDTWAPMSVLNAPSGRSDHAAVWTGTRMIIWGGNDSTNGVNTGGRYDPVSDDWVATTVVNAPDVRYGHSAIWTGAQMIVWGGRDIFSSGFNTGGRYNPDNDEWTATSLTNAPIARAGHTAVWTGTEMIIWGGVAGPDFLDSGGLYDPNTNSWRTTTMANAPTGRSGHTAVWTGDQMIVWGGLDTTERNTGGRYDPSTNTWRATGTNNAPSPRAGHTAVWTDTEMIIWGSTKASDTGGRYNPETDHWTATSTINAPSARGGHTAVWTGDEMVIWGGTSSSGTTDTGGRYNPETDSWVGTSSAPARRDNHTAIWTGNEMIVWGGSSFGESNTGGKYIPSTDNWAATTTIDAPTARYSHAAVWTGNEMIIWGGAAGFTPFDTGGRYSPSTDSWTSTSTSNVPSARYAHTGIWTGTDMIVFGGYDGLSTYFNTGGRYDPNTDNWAATSIVNVPEGRVSHTAIWTGSEMIVWGGFFYGASVVKVEKVTATPDYHFAAGPYGRVISSLRRRGGRRGDSPNVTSGTVSAACV